VKGRNAILLFAHGARDPQWARPFEQIRAQVAKASPQTFVELAFLERMTPDLPAAVEQLAQQAVEHVTVIPLFLGVGGHVKEDLTVLMRDVERRYPAIRFRVTAPIGEDDELIGAIAAWVIRLGGMQ
jgi:sirohydrochlorin cobaltochelatase